MSSAVATPTPPVSVSTPSGRSSVLLVFCCTLIGAVAQIFFKLGAAHLVQPTLQATVLAAITSTALWAAYIMYGINTVLLVLALRNGELSLLYPIISLTYVWVSVLSRYFLNESIGPLKLSGICIIVAGVIVLGLGSRK